MFSQVFVCAQAGVSVQGVSVQGGLCQEDLRMVTCGGTHPTGMHSCFGMHLLP